MAPVGLTLQHSSSINPLFHTPSAHGGVVGRWPHVHVRTQYCVQQTLGLRTVLFMWCSLGTEGGGPSNWAGAAQNTEPPVSGPGGAASSYYAVFSCMCHRVPSLAGRKGSPWPEERAAHQQATEVSSPPPSCKQRQRHQTVLKHDLVLFGQSQCLCMILWHACRERDAVAQNIWRLVQHTDF